MIQFVKNKKKNAKGTQRKLILLFAVAFVIALLLLILPVVAEITSPPERGANGIWDDLPDVGKPVIYLYPEEEGLINVKVDFKGTIVADYPPYSSETGWNVIAYPDGTLVNISDNREYSYLFWEGLTDLEFPKNPPTGFVVKGSEARVFLQQKLELLGLIPREYNEFIVYWYPKLAANDFNLVYFAGKEYADMAQLQITPSPDSILRVFMVMRKIDKPFAIPEQKLTPFTRTGFTVVEWGGTDLTR